VKKFEGCSTTTILSDQSLIMEATFSRPMLGDLSAPSGEEGSSALGLCSGDNCRSAGCSGTAPGHSGPPKSVTVDASGGPEYRLMVRRPEPECSLFRPYRGSESSFSITPPPYVPELLDDTVCEDLCVCTDSDEGRRRSAGDRTDGELWAPDCRTRRSRKLSKASRVSLLLISASSCNLLRSRLASSLCSAI